MARHPADGRSDLHRQGALLVVAMGALTPDGLEVMVEDAEFRWHETLGVSPNTDAATLGRAMTRLAMLYHPRQRRAA